MTEQDIAEQAYNNGYNQAIKDTAYKIECLQEENKILKSPKYGRWKVKFFNAQDKIVELQKQVDKLKDTLNQYMNGELINENVFSQQVEDIQQALKHRTKEIIQWIKLNGILEHGGYVIHDSTIEQMYKKYNVEVE